MKNCCGVEVDPTDFSDRSMAHQTPFGVVVGIQYDLSGKRTYATVAEAVLEALEPFIKAREAAAFTAGQEDLLPYLEGGWRLQSDNPYLEK